MLRSIFPAAVAAIAMAGPALADWAASPQSMGVAAQLGQSFTYQCPPTGAVTQTIWGSGLYTSDSSVCAAAVHSGHITPAGGQISFQMVEGADSYPAATANGVTSAAYGPWSQAFMVTGAGAVAPMAPQPSPRQIGWGDTLITLSIDGGQTGSVHQAICPPGGTTGHSVWGSGIYTSDSAVCLAAVHAGRIALETGGMVTLVTTGAQQGYAASAMNGVTTASYGAWSASFAFQ
jgi:hypothetical protein